MKSTNLHKRHLTTSLLLLFVIIFIGVAGFYFIEDFNFLDSLYMTVITVATVGFQEVHKLSDGGKIFTIFLIISSFGIFVYSLSNIAIYAVEGIFAHYFRENKIKRMIQKLENHVIVCGFGRNGKEAAFTLLQAKKKFVVIEKNEEEIHNLEENFDYPFINGDATIEEVLMKAGIEKANAIITTFPVDADNLFVSLSAREFNGKIHIISRASDEHSDVKLRRAGADKVIMPDKIGGQRMAKLVIEPDTIEFLENIILQSEENITLTEISCEILSKCNLDRTIAELDIRNNIGINIVGIKNSKGKYIVNPTPDYRLENQDKLFVLGTTEQIDKFKRYLESLK
ncbi:MAG: potassium channel protein [Bacteroidales bacterium]|nr:potassium channel protein [Bacteroidales bacterium]